MKQIERHGMANTPLYGVWRGMIARCHCPGTKPYRDYGARGIEVCQRWRDSFLAFYEDMGHPPAGYSLDRIDNTGHYSPENCRWSTRKEQMRNTRQTVYMTLNGVTRPLRDWAEITGIRAITITRRRYRGWSDERALTTPHPSQQQPA